MRDLRWFLAVMAAIGTLACASAGAPKFVRTGNFEHYPLPVWTDDGMYLVSGRSGALFLSPMPLDARYYRGVWLEDIQIHTKRRSRDLKPAEIERLEGYFTRRLAYVFESNGWPILDRPGADVLNVRLSVRDVQLKKRRHHHPGVVVAGVSADKISIALEIRDAVHRDRRLLFGDRRRLPFGQYQGSDTISIRRVEDAFYYFSIDMRRRLEQTQRGEFPPPPPPGSKVTRDVEDELLASFGVAPDWTSPHD